MPSPSTIYQAEYSPKTLFPCCTNLLHVAVFQMLGTTPPVRMVSSIRWTLLCNAIALVVIPVLATAARSEFSAPRVTVRALDGQLVFEFLDGMRGYSTWTVDNPELAELYRATSSSLTWVTARTFIAHNGATIRLPSASGGGLPVADIEGAIGFVPSRVFPKHLGPGEATFSVMLEARNHALQTHIAPAGAKFLVAGTAAHIALDHYGNVYVMLTEKDIISGLGAIAAMNGIISDARLADYFRSIPPTMLILCSGADAHRAEAWMDTVNGIPNALFGPSLPGGTHQKQWLASCLLTCLYQSERPGDSNPTQDERIALHVLPRLVVHELDGAGEWPAKQLRESCDEILMMLSNLGRSAKTASVQLTSGIERYGAANIVLLELIAQSADAGDTFLRDALCSSLDQLVRRGSFSTTLFSGESCVSGWLRRGLAVCAKRLAAQSCISVTDAPESNSLTTNASLPLAICSGISGFVEDCGCKAASSGGLNRVANAWQAPANDIRVVAGNVVARPCSPHFRRTEQELIIRELGICDVSAWIPGGNELLCILDNIGTLEDVPWTLTNEGGGRFLRFGCGRQRRGPSLLTAL